MKIFETRNDLIEKLPKNINIVELGVFKGEFAEELYNRMSPKHLTLVDIWEGSYGSGDKDGNNHITIDNMELVYKGLVEKYSNVDNVDVVRSTSTAFLESQEDNSLDMVYVDADHSYEAVLSDLKLSFQKIKVGGILAGHDYIINTQIAAAVDHFCYSYGQRIVAITRDGCPTFVIQVLR
jgi:hypothetical protein